MSEQLSTPRITAAYLDNFVGRVVMLVGEVTQLRGDQATVESDGTVTVLLNRVSYQPCLHQSYDVNICSSQISGCTSLQRELCAGHWKGEP